MSVLPQIDPLTIRNGQYPPDSYFPDVYNMSFRDTVTREELVQVIRYWIDQSLIPFLNTQVELIDAGRQQSIDALTTDVNNALTQQAAAVNANVEDAVQQVIHANVPIADPIIDLVLQKRNPSSATIQRLDDYYRLSDAKLGQFIANNPGPGNVRQLLDDLYKFRDDYIVELLTRSTNSTARNALDTRYGQTLTGTWNPGWGGAGGAAIGIDGSSEGSWEITDGHFEAHSRIAFGANAAFGGSVVSGISGIGNVRLETAVADGVYVPNKQDGSTLPPWPIVGLPVDSNSYRIFINRGSGLEQINVLGTLPQSSILRFHLSGRLNA